MTTAGVVTHDELESRLETERLIIEQLIRAVAVEFAAAELAEAGIRSEQEDEVVPRLRVVT